jgi:aspartate racemase
LEQLIGIIGGVGPFAGLDFMRHIFANTRAARDQDHIGAMLVSCPALIPDRTRFLLGEEAENPASGMLTCARMLFQAGARFVSVACNTAHASRIFRPFSMQVEESLPGLTLINMLESCALFIANLLPHTKTIGLLATKGTYQSGVYHEYVKGEGGFSLLEPEREGQERIHTAIYSGSFGIKSHSYPVQDEAKRLIVDEGFSLIERGAQALILGCTELPLAVSARDFPVPVLDPALITARRLISLVAPEKLFPPAPAL